MRTFGALLLVCLAATAHTAPARRTGEWRDLDIADQGAEAAAEAGLRLVNSQRNSINDLQQVQLVSVQSQVVAGIKYRIVLDAGESACPPASMVANCPINHPQRYEIVVIDQAWSTPRYTLVSQSVTEIPQSVAPDPTPAPSQNQPGLGGWSQADINDETVVGAAEAGMDLLNAQSNSMFALQHTSIVSAQQQVVNGMKYRIVLDAGESTCPNNGDTHTLENCPVASPSRYTLEVLMVPGVTYSSPPRYILQSWTVADIPATPAPTPDATPDAPCAGCPVAGQVDDDAMAAARAGIELFNAGLASYRAGFSLLDVTGVTTQVVAGVLYHLSVRGGGHTCYEGTAASTASDEATRILAWVQQGIKNGTMNRYGDPVDTAYMGGSPLFNEMTGTTTELSKYVKAKHAESPWNSACLMTPADIAAAAEYTMVVWDQPWRDPRYVLQSTSMPDKGFGHPSTPAPAPEQASAQEGSNQEEDGEDKLGNHAVAGIAVVVAVVMLAVIAIGYAVHRNRAAAAHLDVMSLEEPGVTPRKVGAAEGEDEKLVEGDSMKATA